MHRSPLGAGLTVAQVKSVKGQIAYLSGLAAEEQVVRYYLDRSFGLVERRWRGRCGEIDLIFTEAAALIFVEVKKSRSHTAAARSLTRRQQARILATADEYLSLNGYSQLTDMRFDVALVDQIGAIKVIEAALSEF